MNFNDGTTQCMLKLMNGLHVLRKRTDGTIENDVLRNIKKTCHRKARIE